MKRLLTLAGVCAVLAVGYAAAVVADDSVRGNLLVRLFNEFCLETKGVESAIAEKARQAGLREPRRQEFRFIFSSNYTEQYWDGSRDGIAYTLITRGDRFCQIHAGPPALPLRAISRIFGRAHNIRPMSQLTTVSHRADARHEILGFRLPIQSRTLGKFEFQQASDVSIELVTRGDTAYNVLTLTN